MYQQQGGVKCSLCGSIGTNKSTCPLNRSATKPDKSKHPLASKVKPSKKISRKELAKQSNRETIEEYLARIKKINKLKKSLGKTVVRKRRV